MSSEVVPANRVRIKEPKFVSLVGRPANQRPFVVVRSEPSTGNESMKAPPVRKVRRSSDSRILGVSFPKEYTDDQINETLKGYGLVSYSVQRSDSGDVVALKPGLQALASDGAQKVCLTDDGIVAFVKREEETAPENPKSRLSVVALRFGPEYPTSAEAEKWCADNGFSYSKVVEDDSGILVERSEAPADEETRLVTIDSGVTAVIVRSDATDIPDGYIAVVNETAYGNWGWGQLDFTAKLADRAFSDAVDDAIYALRSVLNEILLYSSLPLGTRKTLVTNALSQFDGFVSGIIDSLPRTMLLAVARSATQLTQGNNMPKENTNAPAAAPVQSSATAAPAAPAAPASETLNVTREELAKMVDEAVEARISRSASSQSDAGPATTAAPADQTQSVGITRADLTAAVAEAVNPLKVELEKLQGVTVVHSTRNDGQIDSGKGSEDPKTRDVFRGLPGLSAIVPRRAKA